MIDVGHKVISCRDCETQFRLPVEPYGSGSYGEGFERMRNVGWRAVKSEWICPFHVNRDAAQTALLESSEKIWRLIQDYDFRGALVAAKDLQNELEVMAGRGA